MLVEIRKHLQYCMGFSFLNEQTYNEDVAETRHQENVVAAKLDMLFKFLQLTEGHEGIEDEYGETVIKPSQRLSRLVMVAIVVSALPFMLIAKPITDVVMLTGRVLDNAVRGVFRGLEGVASLIGNILSFFFGFKKHRFEETKIREEEEYPLAGIFTERKVETAYGAGGQGGAGK